MRKKIKTAFLAFMLVAFSGMASAETIIVQPEVPQEKQKEIILKFNAVRDNGLPAKRIRDRLDSGDRQFKGASDKHMTRYRQFDDGEGVVKTKE